MLTHAHPCCVRQALPDAQAHYLRTSLAARLPISGIFGRSHPANILKLHAATARLHASLSVPFLHLCRCWVHLQRVQKRPTSCWLLAATRSVRIRRTFHCLNYTNMAVRCGTNTSPYLDSRSVCQFWVVLFHRVLNVSVFPLCLNRTAEDSSRCAGLLGHHLGTTCDSLLLAMCSSAP